MSTITPEPLKTRIPPPYPAGRRCEHTDGNLRCVTVISRYREGRYCRVHHALHLDEPGDFYPDLAA